MEKGALLIIILGFIRLAFSQTDQNDMQVSIGEILRNKDNSVGFYAIKEPITVYKSMGYSKVSFSFFLPDFNNNEEIKNTMKQLSDEVKSLNFSALYQIPNPNRNLLTVYRYLVDISNLFLTLEAKLNEIGQYRTESIPPEEANDKNQIKTAQCHLIYRTIFTDINIMSFKVNFDVLTTSVDRRLSLEEVQETNGEKFLKFRQILQDIHANFEIIVNEANNYLEGLQDLSRNIVNDFVFGLLKESTCLAPNPFMDKLTVSECKFYDTNVTCVLIISNPFQPAKLGSIIPIPYYENELIMNNVYFNYSSEELVKLNCKDSNLLKINCKTESLKDDPCIEALGFGYITKILEVCYFKKTQTFVPLITEQGVLIPTDDYEIFVRDEFGNKTNMNIFQDFQPPILIQSSFTLEVSDGNFSYILDKLFTTNAIYYSQFSKNDLIELNEYLSSTIFLTDEMIWILTQSSIAMFASGLLILVLKLSIKIYKKNKTLRGIRGKKTKRYSKELTTFLNGKPEGKVKRPIRKQ